MVDDQKKIFNNYVAQSQWGENCSTGAAFDDKIQKSFPCDPHVSGKRVRENSVAIAERVGLDGGSAFRSF